MNVSRTTLTIFAVIAALLSALMAFNIVVQIVVGEPLRGFATSGFPMIGLAVAAVYLWRRRQT